jgi:hypothetical protein
LPERGRIGIFNRSHYEEVLIVRVHPKILRAQKLPNTIDMDTIWEERYESIRDLEQHLARNGTVIVKFWLHVSKEEQKKRFLSRLDEPKKQWKFNAADVQTANPMRVPALRRLLLKHLAVSDLSIRKRQPTIGQRLTPLAQSYLSQRMISRAGIILLRCAR